MDDALLRDAKACAASRDRTLTSLLEEALRRLLADADRPASVDRVALPVSTAGGGLLPGIDLDDGAALADLMDDVGSR